MKTDFKSMRETWRQQFDALDAEIPALEAQLKEMKQAKHRLAGLLQAGGEEPGEGVVATKSPNGAAVRPLVSRLLRDNDRLTGAEVYDLVHDDLAEQGYDAKGLQLRVNEALHAEGVVEVESGVYSLSGY